MARVKKTSPLTPLVSGKPNKKEDIVMRTRNGKQYEYTYTPGSAPASKAQKSNRKEFGRVNSIVNVMVADPVQYEEAEKRMKAYNRSINPNVFNAPRRYKTVRSYLFFEVSSNLRQQQAGKRLKTAPEALLPRGVKISVKPFVDLTAAELYEILKVRFAVFYLEQNIRYLDHDNIDYTATHFALRRKAQVIAYARLFADGETGVLRIGRMLTIDRGKGFGRYLMQQIIAEAQRQGAHTLRLHAQADAAPFYKHLGFHAAGDAFIEAGIQHILMEKSIK